MFKLIGVAVVSGFAVYGLVTYLGRTTSKDASSESSDGGRAIS